MKKIILFLLYSALSLTGVYAQIPESPKNLPSPTVAGLGLYGEIPVSCFTGTPDIRVPLYDIYARNFQESLSMSYHAAGVRPDQHPGWTGLGWSLNMGGVISRVVHDMPDDYNNSRYYLGDNSGYYFNYFVLNNAAWNQRSYLRGIAQKSNTSIRDTEPDEFTFNFFGYSGKFMLTHERKWEVQCNKPVKVAFNDQFLKVPFRKEGTQAEIYGHTTAFSGFTLTVEDGTQYVFGKDENAIEYSLPFFQQYYNEWIATSWHLTQIIYTDGQKVSFSYERGDFINQMYLAVKHDLGSKTINTGGLLTPECSSWSVTSVDGSYQGQLISPVYLKSLSTPGLHILFERKVTTELRYTQKIYDYQYSQWLQYGNHTPFLSFLLDNVYNKSEYPKCLDKMKWYKLSNIRICNDKQELIREFRFSYNDLPSQRLMLQSVHELGLVKNIPNNTEQKGRVWRFHYNQPEKLPSYLSNCVDHWGFYNGTYAYLDYSRYHSYRDPNPSYLQYGILEKVEHPTGGYTRFVFEPHDYKKQLRLNRWESCEELANKKPAGGLRIKKILNSSTGDATGESLVKEYFYATDYLTNKENASKSSGVLGGQAQYHFSNYIVRAFNDRDARRQISLFSSQSVLPACINSMGSHIGYTEVVEKRADGAFSIYHYTNFDNGYLDEAADAVIQESRTPYEPYTSKSMERGRLIEQADYEKDGKLVREKEFHYERSSANFVRSMKAHYLNVCPGTAISYDEGSVYRFHMYTYRMTRETEKIYTGTFTPITTSTNYQYDDYGLISKVSKSIDNGYKILQYKRPYHYSTNVYKDMVAKHILSPIVDESSQVLLYGSASYRQEQIRYSYTPLNKVTDRLFVVNKIERNTNQYSLRTTYDCHHYDAGGNAVYVTENEQNIIYLWGYGYRYLVAKIRNATLEQVQGIIGSIDSFSSAEEPDKQKLESLRRNLKEAEVTSYTHIPLIGISSMTDPRGQSVYYEYDALGRLILERNHFKVIIRAYDYQYSSK